MDRDAPSLPEPIEARRPKSAGRGRDAPDLDAVVKALGTRVKAEPGGRRIRSEPVIDNVRPIVVDRLDRG